MSNYSYKDYYLSNLNDYYRDYKEYLVQRRCCNKKSLVINNINIVGSKRCCSNNNSNYYSSYSDLLSDKKCCYKLNLINEFIKKL